MIVTYAVMQTHWWQPDSHGECNVSHEVLAAEVRVKERMLRIYISKLIKRGHLTWRRVGSGQAKAYRPTRPANGRDGVAAASGTRMPLADENRHENAACLEPDGDNKRHENASKAARQRRLSGTRMPLLKKTPVDVPEDTSNPDYSGGGGGLAANAADPPPPAPAKPKPARATKPKVASTPAPDRIEAMEDLYLFGEARGFNRARVDRLTLQCLMHHKSKGTLRVDWVATVKTWLMKQVDIDAGTGGPPRGRDRRPRTGWAGNEPSSDVAAYSKDWGVTLD
jgi:hypothetical protein